MHHSPTRLRSCWLALTGGKDGCPRKRFFISMLLVCSINTIATHVQLAGLLQLGSSLELMTGILLNILILPPLVLRTIVGSFFTDNMFNLFRELGMWELIPFPELLPGGVMIAQGTGIPPLCTAFSIILAIATGCIEFGLAWRRLCDAGICRWHLLAGIWGPLVSALNFFMNKGVLTNPTGDWFLYHLGGLWLLWLYCQPSRTPLPSGGSAESHSAEEP